MIHSMFAGSMKQNTIDILVQVLSTLALAMRPTGLLFSTKCRLSLSFWSILRHTKLTLLDPGHDFKFCMRSTSRPVFLCCHNVEAFVLPPYQHGDFHVSCPCDGLRTGIVGYRLFLRLPSSIFTLYLTLITRSKPPVWLQVIMEYFVLAVMRFAVVACEGAMGFQCADSRLRLWSRCVLVLVWQLLQPCIHDHGSFHLIFKSVVSFCICSGVAWVSARLRQTGFHAGSMNGCSITYSVRFLPLMFPLEWSKHVTFTPIVTSLRDLHCHCVKFRWSFLHSVV